MRVRYGDAQAVEAAVTQNTIAVPVESILGEGGVIIPPAGFLQSIREICSRNNVIMIADEIWTSLGRTGKLFAYDHEGIVPDMYLIAKSLGGVIVAYSAVIANNDIM